MTVVCRFNQGSFPPLVLPRSIHHEICDDNCIVSSEWYTIDSELSGYSISIEKEYEVFGILVYKGQTRYLIEDDNCNLGFFPGELFSIVNKDLFFDWKVCNYSFTDSSILIIGYSELCESYSNLISLLDESKDAISIFRENKDYAARYKY